MLNTKYNIFRNWSKDLYIANKGEVEYDDYNNEIVTYNEPFYLGKVNYQPLNSRNLELFMKEYGETDKQIIGALVDIVHLDKIKQFDLAYLYGATPKGERKNGENANYLVRAYKPQNTKIMLLLEKITKEVN